MKAEEFSELSPGQLIPIDGALAFVPNLIPRSITLDQASVKLVGDAENAIGRLTGSASLIVNPYLIGSPLLYREAILSSRIEGTITTPEQLVLLGAQGKILEQPQGADQDTREVLNYVGAMNHGLRRLRELPVSLRLIREIHGELLRGVRGDSEQPGEFRRTQNFIGRRGTPLSEARFVPPPVPQMHAALDDLEKYLHEQAKEVPILVELSLVHYQFETIHPFRDGNGRIGRLLIPLILCSRDRMRDPLLYLSSYFERNREEYMELLLRVSQVGAWADWIRFFLKGVVECAEEAIQQAQGLLALRRKYHERLQKARSSALLQKLVDQLFLMPSITIRQAKDLLQVTPAAAAANVEKLCQAGILSEATGRKRSRVFFAREIIAFMRDTVQNAPS